MFSRRRERSEEPEPLDLDGLMTEARLRELYAHDEITLDELEAGLERVSAAREKWGRNVRTKGDAARPLTKEEREKVVDRQLAEEVALRRCPECKGRMPTGAPDGSRCDVCTTREVQVESERQLAARGTVAGGGGLVVGGVYYESGVDADGDGDVDGGLFDSLG